MWRLSRPSVVTLALAGAATLLLVWLGTTAYLRDHRSVADSERAPAAAATHTEQRDADAKPLSDDEREVTLEDRAELLRRAQVWHRPDVPVHRASLAGRTLDEVSCRFKVSDLGGTTPKFDCVLDGGEEIRIKYGNGPEIPAEAAATRLLKALGFPADDITIVRTLRCYGCPEEPFSVMKAVEITRSEPVYEKVVDFTEFEDFEWVALERKFEARPIETEHIEGWSFFELNTVDPARGGAPRPHVDALRIVTVLLAHWDNKAENQRFVCLSREWPDGQPCAAPLLLLQDVGATFGPMKLDLAAWEKVPMWEDRPTCTVSMRTLPFDGATFGQAQVSEPGRRFIADLLTQLSDQQLTDLFTHARVATKRAPFATPSDVPEWVRVFKQKVREVSEGPPCPAV